MAIRLVGAPAQASNVSAASLTIAKPAVTLLVGDYLIAHLRGQASNSTSDWVLAGWSRAPTPAFLPSNGSRVTTFLYRKVTDPATEPASYTFGPLAGGNQRVAGSLFVLRGIDPAVAFVGAGGAYGGAAITNGKRVAAYAIPDPATVIYAGDAERASPNESRPTTLPTGYTEIDFVSANGTATNVSRTSAWTGMREISGGNTSDADTVWNEASPPGANSTSFAAVAIPSTTQRNLFARPSFEDGLTTGFSVGNAALTAVTASNPALPGRSGTKVLRATITTTGTILNIWCTGTQPVVVPGRQYRFSAYSRAQTAASQAQLYAEYRDSGGVMIAGSQVAGTAVQHLSSQGWVRAELSMPAAPANAVSAFLYWRSPGAGVTAGQWIDFDAILFHEVAAAADPTLPYFDGDTPSDASNTYEWEGAQWASVSRWTALIPSITATFGQALAFTATAAPGVATPIIMPVFGQALRFTAHVEIPPSTLCDDPVPLPEYPQGIRPIQPQELLTANRTGNFYYELRNRDGSKVGALDGVIPGGTLEFDYTARLKAGGKIQIADTGQDIDWLNQRIYIEAHVGDAAWGLGVYLPTAPIEAWSNGHRGWEVELHSKLLILEQDCLAAAYSIPAGTNTLATVKSIIASSGEPSGAITDSTATAPASMFWEAGTPKLSVINDLLDASGYFVLQVDGNGNYRAIPYVTPAQRPVRYTLEDGVSCIYADTFPRDQDIFSVPNRVIAIQQGSGEQESLVGIAENQDPNSPFSYPARGRYITRVYTGVEATDQAALNTYALRMLVDWSAPQATVLINHALVPLAIYDAVQFIYRLGELNSRHVIDKISINLDATQLAQSTLRQVVTYA
jgi:hypothetical protein